MRRQRLEQMRKEPGSPIETLRERAREFPAATGVYLMKDAAGQVIYVGKAVNLRARASSYFGGSPDSRIQVEVLVRKVADIDYVLTNTEKEAFLLENALIKQHRPRYNIMLRDDKTYLSIRLDPREEWPRLTVVRKRPADGALYFGPYTSSLALRETMRTLISIFPLRRCSDACFLNRTRPCLLAEMGKCIGPCRTGVDPAHYQQMVRDVVEFLRGRRSELVERLKREMQEKAARMHYEDAARLRDQIVAINKTVERQRIACGTAVNRDVLALVSDHGHHMIVVFFYREGVLTNERRFELADIGQSPGELLRNAISQLYDNNAAVPDAIFLSAEPEDRELLESWLAEGRGRAVRLHVPQRGDHRRLVDLALENARQKLEDHLKAGYDTEAVLGEIAHKLRLPGPPETIECFDISNIQGSLAVGSMVHFVDGAPNRAGYRLFKIRTVEGANDFAMMHEVMSRRYRRLIESGRPLPDLILVDGGKGQLNVAVEVLKEIGAPDAPLRSIAKSRLEGEPDQRRRTDERFFLPGQKNPVTFPPGSRAVLLLQHVRDEAHRFAITYHQKLRRRRSLRSLLEELPGIGEARKRALLRRFGSLARIRQASADELAAVPGMTQTVAADLHRFLAGLDGEKRLEATAPADQDPSVSEPV